MLPKMKSFDYYREKVKLSGFQKLHEARKSGKYCDFTLHVKNESFRAHRVVLASTIPYFKALFGSNLAGNEAKEVILKDLDPEHFSQIINFVYTGKLKITRENVQSMITISNFLQFKCVSDACLDFLWNAVKPHNVFMVRAVAEFLGNTGVMDDAFRFIGENFDEIVMCKEYLQLPFEDIISTIRRDDLYVPNEEKVFEFVISWVKEFPEERSVFLPELLRYVRMPLLPKEYLNRLVSSEDLIRSSPFSMSLVEEAKNLQILEISQSKHNFSNRERYCRQKQHLKCSEQKGYGIYSLELKPQSLEGKYSRSEVTVHYYDHIYKTWTALCDLRLAYYHQVVCLQEKIYFIQTGSIVAFDPRMMKASRTILLCFDQSGIALYQNKIYIFGGEPFYGNLIQCFDPQDHSCLEVGVMRKYRGRLAAAALENAIYLIGGKVYEHNENEDEHNGNNEEYLFTERAYLSNSGERYSPSTGECTEISPMLVARCDHSCTALKGKVYVFGGLTHEGADAGYTSSCEVYDPSTDQWAFIRNMRSVKTVKSVLIFDNMLHVVGLREGQQFYEVEAYHSEDDQWRNGDPSIFSEQWPSGQVLLTYSGESMMSCNV